MFKCKDLEAATSKGHCPFSCVCYEDSCSFVLQHFKEAYQILEKDFNELRDDYRNNLVDENEMDNLVDENNNLSEELDEVNYQMSELLKWISVELLPNINKDKYNYVLETIDGTDIDSSTKIHIKNRLKECLEK